MATVVSDEARPEIISRGHVSSNRWMLAGIRWSPTAAKTQAVTTTRTPLIRASRPGVAKDLLLSATRCRLPAHPGHAAPRPHRERPSVRWMNSTSTDRRWKDRAVPAASAMIGDAPGAKLIW